MSKPVRTDDAFAPEAYLARIGYSGSLGTTAGTLEALHRAQACSIPFENFDILLGRGIDLEPAAVFRKLVRRRRGGYCFELNQLLHMALTAFGFEVRPLLARVHLSGTPSGRGHMLLLVTLGDRPWIADVGFGGPGLRAPIPFEPGRETTQDGQRLRLTPSDRYGTLLQLAGDGGWRDLYSFDGGYVVPADIAYGNHFTSTHPSSFFTYARVAALARPDGRVSLYDLALKTVSNGAVTERQLAEGPAYIDALREHFGIELDADYSQLRHLNQTA